MGKTLLLFIFFVFCLVFSCVRAQGYATRAAQTTIKVWAPGFMSASSGENGGGAPSSNPQSPDQIAANYDLIVFSDPITVRQEMTRINPKLQILRYINGGFTTPGDPSHYIASSYAYTADGQKIHPSAHQTNTLMNPIDPTRQQALVSQCNTFLASNYTGCFYDTVGGAPTGPKYVTPGVPVYPNTTTPWSTHDWLVAQNSSMLYVTSTLGSSVPVIGNCLADGLQYFNPQEPTSILYGGLQGAMMEQFLRGPTDAYDQYPSVLELNATVNALIDAGNRGKTIVTVTKMWIPGPEYTDLKNNWHKYALATFFLGTHDKAYFNLQYSNDNSSAFQYQIWWNTYIGSPTSSYYVTSNGVFMRNFSLGVAIVNPTAVAATISLPSGLHFVNLWGAAVSGSYLMNATSGDILTFTGRTTSSSPTTSSSTTKSTSSTATTKSATSTTKGSSTATTKSATSTTKGSSTSATTKSATSTTKSATSTTKGSSSATTKKSSTTKTSTRLVG